VNTRPALTALGTAALTLLLSACAVGPDYRAPQTEPARFVHAGDAAFVTEDPEAQWWRQFRDPALDALIERGLAANLDLRLAVVRLQEARALFRDADLDRYPAVTAGAGYERARAQQPGSGDARVDVETQRLGFDAGWELDLFGRVRRGAEAARAEAEGAQAGLRDAQISVAAEIARNYFELRGAQQRLAVAQRNLENQRETLRLTRVRYELGRSAELDVASAQAQLSSTEAGTAPLIAAERRAMHRLAVLVGQRPGALDAELATTTETTPQLQTLAIGAADQLLRRRPDVRIAERNLAAATARVGVATADLFPRISVNGFVGFVSGGGALGSSSTQAWSVAPSVSWAALDLASVRARLRAAEARADGALAAYELTVLRALEDTENAFVGYTQQQARLRSLHEQATASRRAAELARIQYREGLIDFIRLLDAEGVLLQAESDVAEAGAALNTSVVAIYKALGGGWADAT
jgi:multidrug efflux system outer membrane protein